MESPKNTLNPVIIQFDRLFLILFPIGVVLFFSGIFALISFFAAETPAEIIASGRDPIPARWEAGVFNHGTYYRWLLPEHHPFLLGFSFLVFFGGWFLGAASGVSRRIVGSRKKSEKTFLTW